MLINTVILLLRNGLPIFIAVSLLFLLLPKQRNWLWQGLLSGSTGVIVLYFLIAPISQFAEGAGLELLECTLLLVTFFSASILQLKLQKGSDTTVFAILMLSSIILANGTNFIIYLFGYWSSVTSPLPIALGTILGIGICTSIAVLLLLSVDGLRQSVKTTLLTLFAAGQFANIATLLEQVNWISSTRILWNSSNILSDESEYGHFARALFGYEASPTNAFMLFYCFAFVLPFLVKFIVFRANSPNSSLKDNQS
jgi:high-affinity iron transporter